jgi:hypothetical protein
MAVLLDGFGSSPSGISFHTAIFPSVDGYVFARGASGESWVSRVVSPATRSRMYTSPPFRLS